MRPAGPAGGARWRVTGGRRRPLGVATGLVLSFIVASVALIERHELTLRFSPGVSGYAFTFG